MRALGIILILLLLAPRSAAGDDPVLRIAVLKFGTVNWLMDTIREHRLDAAEGYRLEVVGLAGAPATKIAFRSGDVDLVVTDWVWAMHQRSRERDLRFAPYSRSLGSLVSAGAVTGPCDLKGRQVGVVGGEIDKSWLVLQALVRTRCGFDLAAEVRALYGAPPLMARQLQSGAVDAVSTYWHWAAKLEVAGYSRVLDITDALVALGIAPPPPLIGFVWNAGRSDDRAIGGFLASVVAARRILAESDDEWERLRPLMKVTDDRTFENLRDNFRAGSPGPWTPAHTAAAERLHQLLRDLGGAGQADRFDADLFATADYDR